MKLLGLDFETQDDKPEITRITEIGAILTDTDDPGYAKRLNVLCWDTSYPPQTEHIVELTGITDEDLKTKGISRERAFDELVPLVAQADIVVAHNKAFDQKVFEAEMTRQGRGQFSKQWLCTLTEIPYPEKYACKKLSHLAWEHDIQVDRRRLHRADYDVEIMLQLLHKYNLKDILAYAAESWEYLQAVFDAPWVDGGVGKAKAQKLGYGWEKARGDDRSFPKKWVKRVKKRFVPVELEKALKLDLTVREL